MHSVNKTKLILAFLLILVMGSIQYSCNSGDDGDENSAAQVTATDKTWCRDADNDGYGDPNVSLTQQTQPEGYVENSGDCNDYDADIHPGAIEICDGKDNNCNGQADENTCNPGDIQITGHMTNLAEAQSYLTQDSYLQLVYLPANGEIDFTDFTADSQGRLVYTSDLNKINIPSNGNFTFEVMGFSPGQYVIAVQLVEGYEAGSGALPILSKTEAQFAQIEISNNDTASVALGDVFIPLPVLPVKINAINSGPAMPTGVSATDGTYTDKIRVTWNSSDGATSYEVYRADSFMGTKWKIASTAATSYDDISNSCNTNYYYWVKAKNSSGASDLFYSDLGYRKCPEPPPAPAGLSASDGAYTDKIHITWSPSSAATAYVLYRAASAGGTKTEIATVSGTAYDDTAVVCPDTYYYWVKAKNANGDSGLSNSDPGNLNCAGNSALNVEDPPQVIVLPTPTGLSASDGTYIDKIRLTWKASSGATSYDIYRSKDICGEKTKIGTASALVYDDIIAPFTMVNSFYYYWIKAKNSNGVSEYSAYDIGWLMHPPSSPTGVSASDGQYVCSITVTWKPPVPDGYNTSKATSYEIYRAETPDGDKTKLGTISGTSLTDPVPTCNNDCIIRDFYYFIKAVNPAGSSPFSDFDRGYAYETLPFPAGLLASDGTSSCCVWVTWISVPGAKSYDIYRASSPDGAKIKIGSTCCPQYQDSTVTCPNIYYYWVKAVDSAGHSCCTFGYYDSGYCSGCP